MNNQLAVNRIWSVFVVGMAPKSMKPDGIGCTYGNPHKEGNIGCAIACLLPENERLLAFDFEKCHPEGSGVNTLRDAGYLESLKDCDRYLLDTLQAWHDSRMPEYGRKSRARLFREALMECEELDVVIPELIPVF